MRSLLAFLLFTCWAAGGAQVGSLSGAVHDEQGAAVAGAQVTVTNLTAHSAVSATTDAAGQYAFASLPAGAYLLQTAHDGFVTGPSVAIAITAGAKLAFPVTLRRAAAARPQFEAAGVRGLIDPGGYSAPANAAAASGLIKGIADMERAGNHTATPPGDTSCTLQPALLRDAQQKPQSASAHLRLGEFYLAHGQPAKAVPVLEQARSLDGNNQEAAVQLAEAYLRTGRFDEALQVVTSATVQKTPTTYRLLARAEEGLAKFVDASHAYHLAADGDPSEEDLFGVGYELILAGLPREAEQEFAAGIKRIPRSAQLLIGLGSAQFLAGHTAGAMETLLQAVEINPADPRPYSSLSSVAATTQDQAGQIHAAFERFLSLAPQNPHASYYLALIMLREPATDEPNDRQRIEALLKRSITLDPDMADAHFQLGVLYARQGEYQAAAQELEKDISLSPGSKEAHYRLAIAYRQTGRTDASARELQKFRELQAQSPAAKSGMGMEMDQFISVLGKPSPVAAGTLCPAPAP